MIPSLTSVTFCGSVCVAKEQYTIYLDRYLIWRVSVTVEKDQEYTIFDILLLLIV